MVKFYMMIGLPGSGKSFYTECLKNTGAKIFSSDALRKELFGDEENQENNEAIFKELHKRIKKSLSSGNDTVYDATNISFKRRKSFLEELKNIDCYKIAIFMATPYEICLKNNYKRNRIVPENIIKRMYMNFTAPYWYEGWDEIKVQYYNNSKNSYGTIFNWIQSVYNFSQKNKHHSLSLGEHCSKCINILLEKGNAYHTIIAGALHDCGKPFCKTFYNSRGEPSDEAHYYQHQYVGAYDSFFYDVDSVEHLYLAQMIQWHMHPYLAWSQSEKAKNRDMKLLGEQLYNDIMSLHDADVLAH